MAGEGVSYSIKELVQEINRKLDTINDKLDEKADRGKVHSLEARVAALELRAAGVQALSSWQRFWVGTVGIGVLGAVATLVWLASGH